MIILAWPDKRLSPNARTHWALKARLTKAARTAAGWATRASGVRVDGVGAIDLHITFNPPDKRNRDMDNLIASCKGMGDGIADALGVNDHRFRFTLEIGEMVKGGRVCVEIKET